MPFSFPNFLDSYRSISRRASLFLWRAKAATCSLLMLRSWASVGEERLFPRDSGWFARKRSTRTAALAPCTHPPPPPSPPIFCHSLSPLGIGVKADRRAPIDRGFVAPPFSLGPNRSGSALSYFPSNRSSRVWRTLRPLGPTGGMVTRRE